jgi:hypothetical protein
MANSDKNIVITPNRSQSGLPSIALTGQGNVPISLKVLDDAFGTLSFQNSAGTQLFSINNNTTTGSLFSINDTSGLPAIDVNADGTVDLAPYGGAVRVHGHNYVESACLSITAGSKSTIENNNSGFFFYEIANSDYHFITNTNVMSINNSGEGGLLIKKRGILHCMISHDLISSGSSNYITFQVRVNGTPRGFHLITNTNGQWDGMVLFQALKVNANDIVSFNMSASDILTIDRGQWGVNNFLFHAV